MIFHRHKKFTYPIPPLRLDNNIIDEVTSTKFLGVTIQQQLYWHLHIKHTTQKIAKQCGIMYITREFLNEKSLLLLYYTLIYPNLLYCQTVWGAASSEALNPLVVIQKRAIRTIGGLNKFAHTAETFHRLKILKLVDVNRIVCATFMYKCLNGLLPNTFNFTTGNNQIFNMRNILNVRLPLMHSAQSHTNIRYHGPTIYNEVPNDIKLKPTLSSFKNSLKRHLIQSYA